jgi:hypothetical protein
VEFQTTLGGCSLKWYMKYIEHGLQGQAFTLGQVHLKFINEFKLPQSEQKALYELQEIQQREGESSWEYSQKFKVVIGSLAHPIHEDNQRECYIQGLLQLTRIPLTQQRILTLTEALEQSMKIEAMAGYPRNIRMNKPPIYSNLSQLHGKISMLTENIQELTTQRPECPQVWCTGCYTEGHMENECSHMRGMGPLKNLMGTSGPMGGFSQVSVNPPFHTPRIYNTFPGDPTPQKMEYCEICWTQGHVSRKCPIVHKYKTTPNTIHYDLCASTTHVANQCRELDALADILDQTSFRVNETPQGPGRGQGGGDGGGFRGRRNGGRGSSRCYKYNEQGHLSRD